jgi:hypothetical protein
MGYLATYTKQPAEKLDYDSDCSDVVGIDDSVASVTATVTDIAGTEDPALLVVTPVVADAETVKLWIEAGTSGKNYKVEFTVTTTLGRIKQGEIKIKVRDN